MQAEKGLSKKSFQVKPVKESKRRNENEGLSSVGLKNVSRMKTAWRRRRFGGEQIVGKIVDGPFDRRQNELRGRQRRTGSRNKLKNPPDLSMKP